MWEVCLWEVCEPAPRQCEQLPPQYTVSAFCRHSYRYIKPSTQLLAGSAPYASAARAGCGSIDGLRFHDTIQPVATFAGGRFSRLWERGILQIWSTLVASFRAAAGWPGCTHQRQHMAKCTLQRRTTILGRQATLAAAVCGARAQHTSRQPRWIII